MIRVASVFNRLNKSQEVMTVQICSRVIQISEYKHFSSLELSYGCRKPSYNTAVFVMSARLGCSLEPYKVLGKHYDKGSMCILRSEHFFASL